MQKNFHEYSDEKLVALCKQGDEDAYSALVGRYIFAVRSRASIYNNSGIDFEDLVQEGFIGLMNAVNCYDENFGTTFATFAFLCVDRNILSAVKKNLSKKRIPQHALVFIEESPEIKSSVTDNPESVIISKENVSALQKKISEKLSNTERDVLKLYLLGYSYGQIAEKLDCTQKSVDNAIQRMRKKLK